MKYKQPRPEFELALPRLFPTMAIRRRASKYTQILM